MGTKVMTQHFCPMHVMLSYLLWKRRVQMPCGCWCQQFAWPNVICGNLRITITCSSLGQYTPVIPSHTVSIGHLDALFIIILLWFWHIHVQKNHGGIDKFREDWVFHVQLQPIGEILSSFQLNVEALKCYATPEIMIQKGSILVNFTWYTVHVHFTWYVRNLLTKWSCQEREPFIISSLQEQLRNLWLW